MSNANLDSLSSHQFCCDLSATSQVSVSVLNFGDRSMVNIADGEDSYFVEGSADRLAWLYIQIAMSLLAVTDTPATLGVAPTDEVVDQRLRHMIGKPLDDAGDRLWRMEDGSSFVVGDYSVAQSMVRLSIVGAHVSHFGCNESLIGVLLGMAQYLTARMVKQSSPPRQS